MENLVPDSPPPESEIHESPRGKKRRRGTTYHGWLRDPANPCTCGVAVYGDLRIGLQVSLWVSLGGGPPRHHTLQRVREEDLPSDELPDRHNTDTHAPTPASWAVRTEGVSA